MDDARGRAKRSRRGSGAVTLHDVARLANVAPMTASRALNTPARVSPDVLVRVTEVVRQTGYVRNKLAGGLASTRSRLVAAVVPTIAGPVFLQTIQALTTGRSTSRWPTRTSGRWPARCALPRPAATGA
jgi:LacI family gluconate utilization system Gnt-I transcriptional repressor